MKKLTILMMLFIGLGLSDQIALTYDQEFVILYDIGDWDYLDYNYDAEIYVCEGWVDDNGDDKIDADELVGIKDTWYEGRGDTVYIFSHWYDRKDMDVTFFLGTVEGEDCWEYDPATLGTDNHWVWRWFEVDELAEYGYGDWDAFWVTEDLEYVGATFTIK